MPPISSKQIRIIGCSKSSAAEQARFSRILGMRGGRSLRCFADGGWPMATCTPTVNVAAFYAEQEGGHEQMVLVNSN
jgi:hypothetical protein